MKRSDFLRLTSALPLPFLLNGLPVHATGTNPLLELLREQALDNGKVLVLIQMNGGNDGLNTIIPLDQYSALANARSNVLIPENKVLRLNSLPQTGFHPAMTELQNLFNNGQMNIVQGTGYENPNFSHFRAADIWLTGSASQEVLSTGWLGRAQQVSFPGYPDGYPSAAMPDPLAIQIGLQASIVTQCNTLNTAFTVSDPNSFYQLVQGVVDPAPNNAYGHELTFLRLIKQQTNDYTAAITQAYNNAANIAGYPSGNALADQLKIVARLIKGGLKTPVYVVNHPETFDTHANQTDGADTTLGAHARLLTILSQAVGAFQQDMNAMGIQDRVAAMTFTEFGRRVKSNDSQGTDHGTSTPVLFFGAGVNPIMIGSNPVLPANATSNDQVPMQYEFRSVYYSVLKEWFEMTDAQLQSVLPGNYNQLPIFRQVALPVTILSFAGKWQGDKVLLNWSVDHESNIDYYEVQRSSDGGRFDKLGTVNANGVSSVYTYQFTDNQPTLRRYFYRLKIVEKSGAIEYSTTIILESNVAAGTRVKVLPNPVSEQFTVAFEKSVSGPIAVVISDMSGREVWKDERLANGDYNLGFSLSSRKPSRGSYIVNVYAQNQRTALPVLIQ